MHEPFDPYRKWLGIPRDEQPPNHYRLLGVALFEDDVEAISHAADRQNFRFGALASPNGREYVACSFTMGVVLWRCPRFCGFRAPRSIVSRPRLERRPVGTGAALPCRPP